MGLTTCEIIQLLKLSKDLQVMLIKPMSLYCDYESTMKIVASVVLHEKTKHIKIDHHIIQQQTTTWIIHTTHISTHE